MIDPSEAPEGFYAAAPTELLKCITCCFRREPMTFCKGLNCFSVDRKDKSEVVFKQIPNVVFNQIRNLAYDKAFKDGYAKALADHSIVAADDE